MTQNHLYTKCIDFLAVASWLNDIHFRFLFVLAITCHPHDGLHISTDKMIYNFNETIRFSCLDGFFLQGNPERQCLKNGTLQPPFPNCTGIENFDMHINDLLFY